MTKDSDWCPATDIPVNPGWVGQVQYEHCPHCGRRLVVLGVESNPYLPGHKKNTDAENMR